MRLGAIGVQAGKKFTYRQDQIPQIVEAVTANIQRPLFNFLHEHLADGIIKQGVFILKVRVKRGAVDLRLVGHILHGDALEFFSARRFSKDCRIRLRVRLTRGSSFSSGLGNILAPLLLSQHIQRFVG